MDSLTLPKTQRAGAFWERLEKFHKSYSRFVADRITESGVESPRRIRIAVIDTGVDFRHLGIMVANWVGADAKDDDNELHGTNCAYLVHKAAPQADIYVEKVFNKNALGFYEVGNLAKKHNEVVDDIENAIREASIKSPRLMFAAASTNGNNYLRAFPASYDPYVFCVHASEGNGEDGGINPNPPAGSGFNFMTLGIGLEVMERLMPNGGRKFPSYKTVVKSGTSFATPIAAGIAATVLDLAARVEAINTRAENNLRRPEGMKQMLNLMSTHKWLGEGRV
ncbi:peptidase S8/S53 domain-containing protein [Ilyonectria sp. MPI-CAGE-AT-0026]|nr:peptidase S8/S53 domain-containing protein [Ilyonectria sp. MPI-CAGE-AT-0026]